MTVITNIEDLRVLAQKRVPRMFYNYVDSGSWIESTFRANAFDFAAIKLRQRVAVKMDGRSTATTTFGQPTAMPVAIAPTVPAGMQQASSPSPPESHERRMRPRSHATRTSPCLKTVAVRSMRGVKVCVMVGTQMLVAGSLIRRRRS